MDRALRDARATVRHLQAKADAAVQGLAVMTAELAAERQARRTAPDVPRESTAPREQCHSTVTTEPSSAGAPTGAVADQVERHLPVAKRPAGRRNPGRQSVADQEPVQWWVAGWKARSTT
jgi:hypothetical protein